MKRKTFDKQFKIAAVKLVIEDNMTVSEVSKELSIHYNTLYSWISEYEEYGESAFPGYGTALYSYQYEICLLYTSPSPRDPKTSRMPSSA